MVSRQGSLLEQNVANIFNSLGFHTETNVKKKGYEIDVFVRKGETEIILECKQYEKSSLTIRNLIHQWADKNSEIKADKVILVLYGINIKESDKNLAFNRNITLWDEKTLQRYTNLTIKDKEEALKKLVSELDLETDEKNIQDLRNTEQSKMFVMQTLMAGKTLEDIDKEELYGSSILTLKESLQTTLIKEGKKETIEQDKKDYAELFSRAEREGRDSQEKWEKIKEIIKTDNKLFPKGKVKEVHLEAVKYIDSIFEKGKKYFDEKDKKKLRTKLIKTALEYLRSSSEKIMSTFMSKQTKNKIHVHFENDDFIFEIDKNNFSSDVLEKLDWIVDEPKSKGLRNDYKNGNYKEIETIIWSFDNNLNKATKYIEEIFKELYGENEDFDIVLEELYEKPSKTLFWTYIVLGIFTIGFYLIGLIFFYLAYREHKKLKNK